MVLVNDLIDLLIDARNLDRESALLCDIKSHCMCGSVSWELDGNQNTTFTSSIRNHFCLLLCSTHIVHTF
jgi:hypothetical protein